MTTFVVTYYNDYHIAAKNLIERLGKIIVIGAPLGIGKPIGLLNALYQLAAEDQTIDLTILTALTLTRPRIKISWIWKTLSLW